MTDDIPRDMMREITRLSAALAAAEREIDRWRSIYSAAVEERASREAEIEVLREALTRIAAVKYGLQAIHEDYDAGPARDAVEVSYWQTLAQDYQRTAKAALANVPKPSRDVP